MMRHVVIKPHYGGATTISAVPHGVAPNDVVERYQRGLARMGYPTGVTWWARNGGLVAALIHSTKGAPSDANI